MIFASLDKEILSLERNWAHNVKSILTERYVPARKNISTTKKKEFLQGVIKTNSGIDGEVVLKESVCSWDTLEKMNGYISKSFIL